jgi:hypothetical protein
MRRACMRSDFRLILALLAVLWPLGFAGVRTTVAAESVSTDSIDYRLQGEYAGLGRGVQVVALGDGNFEASTIPGGLPGAGGNTRGRIMVKGTAQGESATFQFPDGWLQVESETATWYRHDNTLVGSLNKVRRQSPTLNLAPPSSAERLFVDGQIGELDSAKLSPEEGFLMRGAITKTPVQDFRLHVEFRTPFTPKGKGQGRGNSGLYIQRRYEVQILDSFGHFDGDASECGGLYKQQPASVNMALPPMTWQTYDIWFRQAKFDETGRKITPATITVVHNGVTIHDHYAIVTKTGAGQLEGPQGLPLLFQDHGDDVVYRNVWLVHGETLPESGSSLTSAGASCAPCTAGKTFCSIRPACRPCRPCFGRVR